LLTAPLFRLLLVLLSVLLSLSTEILFRESITTTLTRLSRHYQAVADQPGKVVRPVADIGASEANTPQRWNPHVVSLH
jgi:hypothetical protein